MGFRLMLAPGVLPKRLFKADPTHHPGNKPGVLLMKPSGAALDERCCCRCPCCENIPDTLFALVTDDDLGSECCGASGGSTTITLSKTGNYTWQGSGSLPWCSNCSLFLYFRCTGDLIDCDGNRLPGPCDGSGGMCLTATLTCGANVEAQSSGQDEGCFPTFTGGFTYVMAFNNCENGAGRNLDIQINI